MKKKTLFATVGAGLSLTLAAAALGGFLGNQTKAVKADSAYADATNGTCDFTSAITTAEATHWSVSNFTTKTGYYQSSGSAGAAEYIKFYNATNPFSGHTPTSIVVTLAVAGGSAKSDISWSMSLLDSNGAVISATTQSSTTGSVTTTKANKTWTFTSNVSSAYGVQFDTTKISGWNLRVYSMNVQLGYEVSYDPVTSVSLDKTTATVAAGESTTLAATVLPSTANPLVTWTSSDTSVATVSDGNVTALKPGSVTITATTAGKTSGGVTLSATSAVTVSSTVKTVSEVATLGAALASGASTTIAYMVQQATISVYTSDRQFTISDGTSTMVVYGSYNQFQGAGYIVGGKIDVYGRIKNYSGTIEMCTVDTLVLSVTNYTFDAESLVYYIMAEDTANQCTTKFSIAKTHLLALSTADQNTFKTSSDTSYVNARARYEAWAVNQGDAAPYASAAAFIDNMTSGTAVIAIAVVSVLGLLTLAGVMVMRKKHN
jgi:hypothetical protein